MTIVRAELKAYKALTNVVGGSNGGHMSNNLITSGALNNVFPDVTEAERTAGLTTYRKVFHKVLTHTHDGPFINAVDEQGHPVRFFDAQCLNNSLLSVHCRTPPMYFLLFIRYSLKALQRKQDPRVQVFLFRHFSIRRSFFSRTRKPTKRKRP